MTELIAELEEALQGDQGILEAFAMSLVRAEPGLCHLSAVVPTTLVNAGGFAHGSIAFALMDTACAYAIRAAGRRGVTSNANVTYVRGAKGEDELLAEVTVVSQTRRVATLRGETYLVQDGQRELAAHGSFVFQLRAADDQQQTASDQQPAQD